MKKPSKKRRTRTVIVSRSGIASASMTNVLRDPAARAQIKTMSTQRPARKTAAGR